MEYVSKFASRSGFLHRRHTALLDHIALDENARLQLAIIHQLAPSEIDTGININYHDATIDTPLHFACRAGSVEWVCMLLYHGADPNIPSQHGILPIMETSGDGRESLVDVLFPYTFDTSRRLSLRFLAAAMMEDSSLFCRIVETVTDVDYDAEDAEFLFSHFKHVKPEHFQVFVEKFGAVVAKLVDDGLLPKMVEPTGSQAQRQQRQQCFDILLTSSIVTKFASIDPVYSSSYRIGCVCRSETTSLISSYIGCFLASEDQAMGMVLVMVSHGLPVTVLDLDAIYRHYGNCELFRLLLYLDIETDESFRNIAFPVLVYCNPKIDIQNCPDDDPESLAFILNYYNHNQLKELLRTLHPDGRLLDGMSQIPTLVELSRNAARRYLVQKYDIDTSKKLHLVLDSLPIDRFTKKIIALEHKLYLVG